MVSGVHLEILMRILTLRDCSGRFRQWSPQMYMHGILDVCGASKTSGACNDDR